MPAQIEAAPRWTREPTLTYIRTEVELNRAPDLEPDWREDILELRNTTESSFEFATVFEDLCSGGVEPADRAELGRGSIGHCGNALRSRTLAPGESFVMRAPSEVVGWSRAWMNVRNVATNEQLTMVSDKYDSAAVAPTRPRTDRD